MENSRIVHAFEYLDAAGSRSPALAACTILNGAELFLARLVLRRIGDQATSNGISSRYDGSSATWRELRDELRTASLFDDGSRVVVIDSADEFIAKHRSELEAYAANPAKASRLILVAKSFPSNTRLAKIIAETGLQIACALPEKGTTRKTVDQKQVVDWLVRHAQGAHALSIDKGVMQSIFEMVGDNLGLIDQELAKLAVYVESGKSATKKDVAEIVGGWRTRTTWELMDAITDRKPAEALTQLARLLIGGEQPQMIFGALSWWFRRFAAATQHVEWQERQGKKANLEDALLAGGFRKFPPEPFQAAQLQLRRLGRPRAQRLFRDLLAIDLKLKGSHAAPDRARRILEALIVDLCTTP